MKNLRKTFERHDTERFSTWKELLLQGKTKINAKQLYPHDLVKLIMENNHDDIVEEQWKVLSSQINLKNCLPVVDVSSSMLSGSTVIPLHVSIALGIIMAENINGFFHNYMITFHSEPTFSVLCGKNLKEKVSYTEKLKWGGSTNIESVFKLLLNIAKEKTLQQENIPKRIFIISDMEFDQCHHDVTNWENIKKMYDESGYQRPEIVFWNVNGSSQDFPVQVNENGVCLISGFSTSILKNLLSDEPLDCMNILRNCLDNTRYDVFRETFVIN